MSGDRLNGTEVGRLLSGIGVRRTSAERAVLDRRTLALLEHAAALCERADELRAYAVEVARQDGRSWGEIGAQLGITRQAAQQRYGNPR